ncbi:beta-hydroxylase [Corynebacterium sp. NML140438]|uniref:carbonic anhydrase n=1 Tax=Corynebacterium sp. NML140438 TaxID=1906334 RepID=UPI0008FAF754|nr:carbonic anhydrase [Corynebacterium sp. NML140438]OIR41830.1 beta-hydroxylase [Corynebacterium sp. NML140438]
MSTAKTPREVWELLKAGNERFVASQEMHPHRDRLWREQLRDGQHPIAAVVACSDSRVPVELLFDVGFGDIFVIRTAGGCVDAAVSASVEYAVEGLNVPLVMFLSHESCGAVGTALHAVETAEIPDGLVRVFVEKIVPSVLEAPSRDPKDVEVTHANLSAQHLIERVPVLAERLANGTLGVVAARYQLADGEVHPTMETFGIE